VVKISLCRDSAVLEQIKKRKTVYCTVDLKVSVNTEIVKLRSTLQYNSYRLYCCIQSLLELTSICIFNIDLKTFLNN
jgi:hypothetical protein